MSMKTGHSDDHWNMIKSLENDLLSFTKFAALTYEVFGEVVDSLLL